MGTNKPEQKRLGTNAPASIPLILLGAAMLLLIVALFRISGFHSDENEAPKLKPQDKAKLHNRLREIDDSEQYALVAITNGLYPCLHSGFQIYYLKAGEVWKYGVTSKGESGRYQAKFLLQNNVLYVVQYRGNIAECLKQEQIKLYAYPFLPENLVRLPELRLPRPPFNPIMR